MAKGAQRAVGGVAAVHAIGAVLLRGSVHRCIGASRAGEVNGGGKGCGKCGAEHHAVGGVVPAAAEPQPH